MRRLLLRLSLFVPIVIAMAAVNWIVDPARLLRRNSVSALEGDEAIILEDLRAGRPHTIDGNYNLPLVVDALIRDRKKIDVLVLGSSICTSFNTTNFPGQIFLNGAVSGGDLEEAMCIYELALEGARQPKRVILEVHGWGFMLGERPAQLVREFAPIFDRALKHFGFKEVDQESASNSPNVSDPRNWASSVTDLSAWWDPYEMLISPRYLQLSVHALSRRYWRGKHSANDGLTNDERNVLFPDGSLQWSPAMRSATPTSIRQRFADRIIRVATIEQRRPNPARCRLFETFILRLLQAGTQVDILLTPPLHWTHEAADSEYRSAGQESPADQTERYVLDFARKHHLQVFGAFEQRRTDLIDVDYVDDVHIRRESIDKLLLTKRN